LEVYEKNFPDFVCGNSTSTKALDQDEKTKAGPSRITQKEEMQTKKPENLKGRTTWEKKCILRNHKILEEGAMKKKP
jgi:hypothetical protein